MQRAAIYARVSGDDTGKEGRNLAAQLAICSEYADQNGYEIIAEFAEDERGVSGADPQPPQLERVIKLAQAGRFDVLIVREVDRLARNLAKQLNTKATLKDAGVRVEYALQHFEDNPGGRLSENVTAVVAEFEREQIIGRTTRGKLNKVKAGHIITNKRPPYGFIGKEIDGKRTIVPVPDEARIIRQIFHWYVYEGYTMRGIATKLTQVNTPTYYDNRPHLISPNKKRQPCNWATAVIAQILSDPVYVGSWQYHNAGEVVTVAVEPIVTPDLFTAAQNLRAKNKKHAPRNTKYEYLMRGRLKCKCGYSMQCKSRWWDRRDKSKVRLYYRPIHSGSRDLDYVDCDASRYFPAGEIDNAVWYWLKSLMRDPGYLPRLYAQHKSQQDKAIDDLREQLKQKEKQLEQATVGLSRLLSELLNTADGSESKKLLRQQQSDLEVRIAGLKNEASSLKGLINTTRITDDDIAEMTAYFVRVSNALRDDNETFEQRRRVIEMLDVTGVVYELNNEPYIDIYSLVMAEKRVSVSMVSTDQGHNSNNVILLPIQVTADV
jgi:site-specific DNA recombinase